MNHKRPGIVTQDVISYVYVIELSSGELYEFYSAVAGPMTEST